MIIIGGGILIVILLFVIFTFGLRSKTTSQQSVTITIWGTDEARVFNDVIASYSGPGTGGSTQIKYTQMDPSQYENQLLSALAAGTGPDIFEIGNRELSRWQNVSTPLPSSTLSTQFSLVTLENDFPTVVGQDFVSDGQIYALPLSIDTLAMIYNRDLFDSASLATLPKTWNDFQNEIPALRVVNSEGQITQAAAAIGGSDASIANAQDILFLLMLQNGTQMTRSDFSSVTFASGGSGGDNSGLSAFNFYLQFANAASPYYTWNDGMGDAENSFVQGKTAILFDYKSSLADIKTKAPFLNVGIGPMPQPSGATVDINYPKYTGLAVAKGSLNSAAAWNVVVNLTTSAADESIYIKDTGEPPALRTVIQAYLTDPTMTVFAAQALTARSWHEVDDAKIDDIMNTAIQNVLNGAADSTRALNEAQSAMNTIGN